MKIKIKSRRKSPVPATLFVPLAPLGRANVVENVIKSWNLVQKSLESYCSVALLSASSFFPSLRSICRFSSLMILLISHLITIASAPSEIYFNEETFDDFQLEFCADRVVIKHSNSIHIAN